MRTVADVMTRGPITIDCHEVLEDAVDLMSKEAVHHLVVLDRGRLAGVLSDRDLFRFECGKRVSPSVVEVAEAMCPDPIVADPQELLGAVAARMATTCSEAAVVLQDGRVVGIFTITDALRLLAADNEAPAAAMAAG